MQPGPNDPVTTPRLAQLLKLHASEPGDPFCMYGIAQEHARAVEAAKRVSDSHALSEIRGYLDQLT
jgi:hypothetical protein